MDKSARDGKITGLDLSQKWLRHLREATKTTVALPCRFCRDHKILSSEALLWQHVLSEHLEKVPKEKEAQEKFRETLKSSIKSRYVCSVRFEAESAHLDRPGSAGIVIFI
jgi:hypothetical protein